MIEPPRGTRVDELPWIAQLAVWELRNRRWLYGVAGALFVLGGGAMGIVGVLPIVVGLWLWARLVVDTTRSEGVSMSPSVAPRSWGLMLGCPPFAVRRGDFVVFLLPGTRPAVKRVVALAGDVVVFRDGGAFVERNGTLVDLPLVADLNQTTLESEVRVVVEPGCAYALGEHVGSVDSRRYGPVPLSRIVGRYLPLIQWGKPDPVTLDTEDQEHLAAIRAADPPFLPRLERMLEVGGFSRGHLVLGLRRALLEAGLVERVDAVLERAWADTSFEVQERRFLTGLLCELHIGSDAERVLAVVQRQLILQPEDSEMKRWQCFGFSRLYRWQQALDLTEEISAKWGEPLVPAAARVVALIGLGRTDEARQRIAEVEAEDGWPSPAQGPYYRGLLAAVEGLQDEAVTLLNQALDEGFTDRDAMRRTPLLSRLRSSELWNQVRL